MFSDQFERYLSFGAADQETFKMLEGHYDGIVVPATVAVFQKEGTGGFLLALSAAAAKTKYVIDPRSPLFQQALPRVKKAHVDLATVLGNSELASTGPVNPTSFDTRRIAAIAANWVAYNETYRDTSGGKFDKYAKRLGQPVTKPNAQGPELILAPYFVASSASDPWHEISTRLFDDSRVAASRLAVVPVIATDRPEALVERARGYNIDRLVVWVSGMDELTASRAQLQSYAESIRRISAEGKSVFALYGGFFAIALRYAGLAGFNHGVGFGDSREWRELPNSGAPMARYYLLGAHRYVPPEFAQQLYGLDPDLVICECTVCQRRPPLALDYHELMQHSVLCREQEVRLVATNTPSSLAVSIETYELEYRAAFAGANRFGNAFAAKALGYVKHLETWRELIATL